MLRIGVTGQNGFVGYHLTQTIKYCTDFELVNFEKCYFTDEVGLDTFVSNCDIIVHLAAMNRHADAQVIFDTNIALVQKLIDALNRTNAKPHVLMSSSIQEERDNMYGKSKKEGRKLLEMWAKEAGSKFTGLLIPNVFGPFGLPNYNSVVATFCHQISRGIHPKIDIDGDIKLIYVGDLVGEIIRLVKERYSASKLTIAHTQEIKVSEILNILQGFESQYHQNAEIPSFGSKFELDLFNTFRTYFEFRSLYPKKFKKNTDPRGVFVELIKLNIGGQVSFSTTVPGITRGNHFHTRKIERFAVIKGKALIQLRRIGTEEVYNFELDGEEPSFVDMPIWFTHNIKNIGQEELITIFWINEFYNPEDPDTYFEEV
ncbi:NAD-dependent epimerase/dehydratase family protein [Lacihabitans sp. CS3-21]|uniref:polysaccharide biosynthesis C-terminal domain-containing protein n=1 Tax=Lacihabitans sp. CS3-21 TaxID=2487332 RepID=UPI0020CB6F9C|nr:NAD-dependent epimerase/dehydratase family protein [Lacihabitans sp. CS3-21]MCP9747555.1 SDR family oxidoreductase [Lacihabitans sp. CS3-21]